MSDLLDVFRRVIAERRAELATLEQACAIVERHVDAAVAPRVDLPFQFKPPIRESAARRSSTDVVNRTGRRVPIAPGSIQDCILQVVKEAPEPIAPRAIRAALEKTHSESTITNALTGLIKARRLTVIGNTANRRYAPEGYTGHLPAFMKRQTS